MGLSSTSRLKLALLIKVCCGSYR